MPNRRRGNEHRTMNDRKTRVILVRHGESNVTVQRILGGEKSCTGLSDLGQKQASALHDRLDKEKAKVDHLYASTMPRAMETAEIIQPSLRLDQLHLDPELVEQGPVKQMENPMRNWKLFLEKAITTGDPTVRSLRVLKVFLCSITVSPQHLKG